MLDKSFVEMNLKISREQTCFSRKNIDYTGVMVVSDTSDTSIPF